MSKKIHHYTMKTLQEIFGMSERLAQYFPDPPEVMTGIYELLLNALEHGNLSIGSETKRRLILDGRWEEEIQRRLALPENSRKEVKIYLAESPKECELRITDEGNGFDWNTYLHKGIEPTDPFGKGILIASKSGFDKFRFNAPGNEVTCIVLRNAVNPTTTI